MEKIEKKTNLSNNDKNLDISESEDEYTNSLNNKKDSTKTLISCHNKFLINPSITKFNANSKFIYDLDEGKRYIDSVNNANKVKLNENEINILNKIYITIQEEETGKKTKNYIFIEKNLLNDINEFFYQKKKFLMII